MELLSYHPLMLLHQVLVQLYRSSQLLLVFFGQCRNAVVCGGRSLFLGIKGGGEQHQCDNA